VKLNLARNKKRRRERKREREKQEGREIDKKERPIKKE
jgi:hypothetical protein